MNQKGFIHIVVILGDIVGQFQIENRGVVPEFLLEDEYLSKFDYIFVSLQELGDLARIYDFLGIDRDTYRQERERVWQRHNNRGSSQLLEDLKQLGADTWVGLFNDFTKVVLFSEGRILQSGTLASIDKQRLLIGLQMEEKPSGLVEEFSLAYDPQTDRLVSGKGHDDAHTNLGYTNFNIKCIENWTPWHLTKLKLGDYEGHTVYIRGLLVSDLAWLPQFASKLVESGFSTDVCIASQLYKGRGVQEDFRTTIGQLLSEDK